MQQKYHQLWKQYFTPCSVLEITSDHSNYIMDIKMISTSNMIQEQFVNNELALPHNFNPQLEDQFIKPFHEEDRQKRLPFQFVSSNNLKKKITAIKTKTNETINKSKLNMSKNSFTCTFGDCKYVARNGKTLKNHLRSHTNKNHSLSYNQEFNLSLPMQQFNLSYRFVILLTIDFILI